MDDDDLLELLEAREEEPAWSPERVLICRCNCVEEHEIDALLDGGASVDEITRRTGAGGSCSSCLPQIRRMAMLRRPLTGS